MIQFRENQNYRKVWYLDTKNFELKNNNFTLQIRGQYKNNGDLKEYDIVIKNRDDDIHNALKYESLKCYKKL